MDTNFYTYTALEPEGRNITDTLVIPDQWFTVYGIKENMTFSVNDSVPE